MRGRAAGRANRVARHAAPDPVADRGRTDTANQRHGDRAEGGPSRDHAKRAAYLASP